MIYKLAGTCVTLCALINSPLFAAGGAIPQPPQVTSTERVSFVADGTIRFDNSARTRSVPRIAAPGGRKRGHHCSLRRHQPGGVRSARLRNPSGQNHMGARGTLYRVTSITLAVHASRRGGGSVLETVPAKTAPAVPAPAKK